MTKILPPYNQDLEEALLHLCLVNNEALSLALEQVTEDMFYVRHHPNIWNAITKTYNAGKEVTPVTISSYFQEDNIKGYISDLNAGILLNTIKEAPQLIERLIDLWKKRKLMQRLDIALEELESDDPEDTADKTIDELEALCYELSQKKEQSGPSLEGMNQALEAIQNAINNEGVIGVSSGFKSIDGIIGGFAKSDLSILAGRPSMGKTSLALCIAECVAEHFPVLFCSLEMSAEQISVKRLSLKTNIPVTKMREGNVNQEEVKLLIENSNPGNLWIDDQAALSPDQLLARARRLKQKQGLGLIVVDYLQLMTASKDARRQGTVAATTEISKRLKQIAKDLDVPVIALSQLSRSLESRENKRPMLSDLRESGAIEQDADSVLFVYRDEYYLERDQPQRWEKESDEKWAERLRNYHDRLEAAKGKAEVIVGKNRHGRIGSQLLNFIPELTKFEEVER